MTICIVCKRLITNQVIRYAGDARVCSKQCSIKRIMDIESVDKKLENPSKWDEWTSNPKMKRTQSSALLTNMNMAHGICNRCGFQASAIACPFKHHHHSVLYCSPTCLRLDWMDNHSNVCNSKEQGQVQIQSEQYKRPTSACPGWLSMLLG